MTLAALGEGMLEVFDAGDGNARFSYGGDTLNTAVYLARLGAPVAYLTALGDDAYSHFMLRSWETEGIDTAHVLRAPGEVPGLYTIRVNDQGERSFLYWRSAAPVKRLFSLPGGEALAASLASYRWLYFSGITLMVLNAPEQQRFLAALHLARAAGCRIAFDSNYRARGWPSARIAAEAMAPFVALAHIVLPGLDDEQALHGLSTPEEAIAFYRAQGKEEIVLKQGSRGVHVSIGNQTTWLPANAVTRVVDSTAAGDAFNAGYLAKRMLGDGPVDAARFGAELAAVVVQNPGAIIERARMASFIGALAHRFSTQTGAGRAP